MQGERGFCRDCLTDLTAEETRCLACGSPRLLRHPDLARLSIAHLDCDAFYAAIEKRDNPDLLDKPLIIGGGKRGVVSTACYIARTYGVHSAQPMFKALKACPDAVVVPPDMEKYSTVGKQVREKMRNLTPLVEPISIDEAFMDLSGTERLHGMVPAKALARMVTELEAELGITVSVGLAPVKFLAKMASDERKPRGFFVLGASEVKDYLAAKPVKALWGVGKAMAKKMERDGLTQVSQLQTMDESTLGLKYGELGLRLYRLSRGIDTRAVTPHHETKSVSSETTFFDDVSDLDELDGILWRQCERVARRAKASGHAGYTVTLKLKTASFQSRTRSRTLHDPTQLAEVIYKASRPLLDKEADGTKFRLLGVGISNLADPEMADPGDLVDEDGARKAKTERALEQVREKFGTDVINKGRGLKRNKP